MFATIQPIVPTIITINFFATVNEYNFSDFSFYAALSILLVHYTIKSGGSFYFKRCPTKYLKYNLKHSRCC